VIDGAKALRAAIEWVFGERAEVQRCQIHKRRNVKEHLSKSTQGDTDRRIRNAYAMTSYAAAKAELEKIFLQLERINSSAARSLEEGLEETLTVHRLGVGTLLRRTLASTNPIESYLSTVERVAGNVKRWRAGDHALRWTATGLLEAENKFRKVKGYRELEVLQRKLNPSYAQRMNKRIESILPEDMNALVRYPWPGNVRELQNIIERSVILSAGSVLHRPALPELKRAGRNAPQKVRTPAEAEREHILQTLQSTDWVIGGPHGAAAQLEVRRTTLICKMRRLGIFRPQN